MKSSGVQRWDLLVGALASLIAVGGVLLSIAVGNTESIGLGNVRRETQYFLATLSIVFFILVAIKAGLRYRSKCQTACTWSIDRLLNRPSRQG